MAERGVRSVSELARRLQPLGIEISSWQLGRLIDNKSTHWNQGVIEGLLAVFECSLSDLIEAEGCSPRLKKHQGGSGV